MCLIITFIASIIAFINYLKMHSKSNFYLFLMYGSATIMWLVDCTFSKINEDEFLNLSLDDTYLGLTVVVLGYVLFKIFTLKNLKHA